MSPEDQEPYFPSPRMAVTYRKVKRFYFNGKGYCTERKAWEQVAKYALRDELSALALAIQRELPCSECQGTGSDPFADDFKCSTCGGDFKRSPNARYPEREAWFKAYSRKFPHDEDGECLATTGRGMCAEIMSREEWGYESSGPKYAWCKTAYKRWIGAKIVELKKETEAQS